MDNRDSLYAADGVVAHGVAHVGLGHCTEVNKVLNLVEGEGERSTFRLALLDPLGPPLGELFILLRCEVAPQRVPLLFCLHVANLPLQCHMRGKLDTREGKCMRV